MKSLSQNIYLPKITHRAIQELINKNKNSPLIDKNLGRHSYHPQKQNSNPLKRYDRHTDLSLKNQRKDFMNEFNQNIQIKSPFYQRLHLQNSDKCPCQFHRMKKSTKIPQLRKTQASYYEELVNIKNSQISRHHKNQIIYIKNERETIHRALQNNEYLHLQKSLEHTSRIRQQKQLGKLRNKTIILDKISKTRSQNNLNKQFKKVFFKEKLQKIYNLQNQNKPFQKILVAREKWEKDRKNWAVKLYRKINSKLRIIKDNKLPLSNQNHDQNEQIIEETCLLDMQKCIAPILNGVLSIQELLDGNQNQKIANICMKKLNIKQKEYVQTIIIKLHQYIQQIKDSFSGSTNTTNSPHLSSDLSLCYLNELKSEQLDEYPIQKAVEQQKDQDKQKYLSEKNPNQLNDKSFLEKMNSSFLNGLSQSSFKTNEQNSKKINLKKISQVSQISQKSAASKKLSKISKLSFISNSLSRNSNLTKRKEDFDIQKSKRDEGNISAALSKNSSRVMIDSSIDDNTKSIKRSGNCSLHATPSMLSKHIISEKEQWLLTEEQEEKLDEDFDQQQNLIAKVMKYKKSAQQIADQQDKQQLQKASQMIEFIKNRIRLRQANIPISCKYQHIKYQNFCSKSTFGYISSTIDDIKGIKKFKFLYGQLQLKKKILQDNFIQDSIKQFASMFNEEDQLNQWKKYLLQHRSKVMFQQLNRMIDMGIKQMDCNKILPIFQQKEQTNELGKSQENQGFEKFDQSQAAYQRYLQKLERKQFQSKNGVKIIQRQLKHNKLGNQKDLKDLQLEEISQKTIQQNIEASSNKMILYSSIQNKRELKTFRKIQPQLTQSQRINDRNLKEEQTKKKVLKYLLKKNPNQFQILNRDVNNLSHLISSNFKE